MLHSFMSSFEPTCRQYCSQGLYQWLGNMYWPQALLPPAQSLLIPAAAGVLGISVISAAGAYLAHRYSAVANVQQAAPNTNVTVSATLTTPATMPVPSAAPKTAAQPVVIDTTPKTAAQPVITDTTPKTVAAKSAHVALVSKIRNTVGEDDRTTVNEDTFVRAYINAFKNGDVRRKYFQSGGNPNAKADAIATIKADLRARFGSDALDIDNFRKMKPV